MPMTMHEAVLYLRRDPRCNEMLRDVYLEADAPACAGRFYHSAEFAETRRLLGALGAGVLLDLGAGNGIASYALSLSGARRVYALEPDPSAIVGCGAIRKLTQGMPVEVLAAYGEAIPLSDEAVDAVYARQVLHHTHDPVQVLRECARVLRPGGIFLACREHVVDDEAQRQAFLRDHPIHQLTGGENAFPLPTYLGALRAAGLRLEGVLGPWDSVINTYPGIQTPEELARYPQTLLGQRLGALGRRAGSAPLMRRLVWWRLNRPLPGRLYTFWGRKA